MSVPSAPVINPQPRSSDGTLELAWNPPETPGGTITAYAIGIYGDPGYSGAMYTTGTDGAARYIKIEAPLYIPNGTDLYINIAAVNASGTGPVAKFRAPWQTGNKPGVPNLANSIYNGNGVYTVTWEAGADGGATIFWYVITATSDNSNDNIVRISVDGNTSSKVIQGLNPASNYVFTIQAVNCPGYSPALEAIPIPLEFLQGLQYAGVGDTWEKDVGFDATLLNGTATWNTPDDNGLVLDGSTSWEFPSLGLLTTYTINVWYKNTGPGTGGSPCIITEEFPGGQFINFMIGTNVNGSGSQFVCGFWNFGWSTGIPFTLVDDVWTNIQYTWDGTHIITYIDGVSIGSVAPGVSVGGNGLPIRIGRRWDAAEYVNGIIGEVRIYNTALNASQILAAYNESSTIFS
jgi:hypothetical protein